MILPARLTHCWSQWASITPTINCALGTPSPELTDGDSDANPQVLQLPEGDTINISCGLDPDAFQNTIPDDQGGRSSWTETQRGKAQGCPILHTASELSNWVSVQVGFWMDFLTVYEQLNGLPHSGKPTNRVYRRIESTFGNGSVLVPYGFWLPCFNSDLSGNPFTSQAQTEN